MAFTTTTAVLSLMAALTAGQFLNSPEPFGNDEFNNFNGFGNVLGNGFPQVGGFNGGLGLNGGLANPFGGALNGGLGAGYQHHPTMQHRPTVPGTGKRLATVHARNKAGDMLLLTISEMKPRRQSRMPFPGHPLGALGLGPLGLGGLGGPLRGYGDDDDMPELRVHGFYVKADRNQVQAVGGDSLHGTFAMVVTENGNTDAWCAGTGAPLRALPPRSPMPFGGAYGGLGGPLGALGNPFMRHMMPGMRKQQPMMGDVIAVTTGLHASTGTSTIEGKIHNMRLSSIFGRALQVCADEECRVKTDMCGIIRRDDKTAEEFKAMQHHQMALAQAHANGQAGLLNGNGFGQLGNQGLNALGQGGLGPVGLGQNGLGQGALGQNGLGGLAQNGLNGLDVDSTDNGGLF